MAFDYAAIDWAADTPLSAENFNGMELLAAALKSHVDAHAHSAMHYTKTLSDAKFFPQATGLDAEKIDGKNAAALMGNQAALGFIIMHRGADPDFTNGYLTDDPRWHQCDGSTINGIYSPDMRGYFPKCPNLSNTTGETGAATQTFTGTVTVGDHTLTVSEIPAHYHTMADGYYTGNIYVANYTGTDLVGWDNEYTDVLRTTDANHVGADQSHNHGNASISLNAINLTPLWKSFWFLIKVA